MGPLSKQRLSLPLHTLRTIAERIVPLLGDWYATVLIELLSPS